MSFSKLKENNNQPHSVLWSIVVYTDSQTKGDIYQMGTKVQNLTGRCQILDRHVQLPVSLFFHFFCAIYAPTFIQNCLLDIKLNAQGYRLHI